MIGSAPGILIPCGVGREKARVGPRPSNPLSQGPQLHAKNSTFGEWQLSWGRLSSLQEASRQNGHHQIQPSVASPEASDYSVDFFFLLRVYISLLSLHQNKAELSQSRAGGDGCLRLLGKSSMVTFLSLFLRSFCLFVCFLSHKVRKTFFCALADSCLRSFLYWGLTVGPPSPSQSRRRQKLLLPRLSHTVSEGRSRSPCQQVKPWHPLKET